VWTLTYFSNEWAWVFLYFALLGRRIRALVCRWQRDVKALIAYRRVAHINYSLVILILCRRIGDRRGSIVILVHRVVRSIILLLGGICLHFVRTRIIYLMRMSLALKESFFLLLVGVIVSNFSFPPLLGLLREIRGLIILLSKLWAAGAWVRIYLLLVAYYSLLFLLSFTGRKSILRDRQTKIFLFILLNFILLNFLFLRAY
jgi:NADH:ubiquinone oxidoreductase subunit 4 (subunit M)